MEMPRPGSRFPRAVFSFPIRNVPAVVAERQGMSAERAVRGCCAAPRVSRMVKAEADTPHGYRSQRWLRFDELFRPASAVVQPDTATP